MPRSSDQIAVDDVLTKVMNADASLQQWMAQAMVKIANHLGSSDNYFFHVKGGTSLALYLQANGTNPTGIITPSDWDTQLVVNPTLPPSQWYPLVEKLRARVLEALQALQVEFSQIQGIQGFLNGVATTATQGDAKNHLYGADILLAKQRNLETVLTTPLIHPLQFMDTAASMLREEPESAWPERVEKLFPFSPTQLGMKTGFGGPAYASILMNHAIKDFYLFRLMVRYEASNLPDMVDSDTEDRFRAELIDISIPRRDTVEALQQWHATRPRLMQAQNIPIPNHEYHLEEQIKMVRENLEGGSPSPHKLKKRLQRGVAVCNAVYKQQVVMQHLQELQKLAPKTVSVMKPDASAFVLIAALAEQLLEAYELRYDPSFRDVVDQMLAKAMANLTGPDAEGLFMEFCRRAGLIATELDKHLTARSDEIIKKNWQDVRQLLQAVEGGVSVRACHVTGLTPTLGTLYPSQTVVTGDLAALLQLTMAGRHQVPCPVQSIVIRSYSEALSPNDLLKFSLESLDEWGKQAKVELSWQLVGNNECAVVYKKTPLQLGDMNYELLLMRIQAVQAPRGQWPATSRIEGITTLAPRAILSEYEHRLARTEELRVVGRMQAIVSALRQVLTQF